MKQTALYRADLRDYGTLLRREREYGAAELLAISTIDRITGIHVESINDKRYLPSLENDAIPRYLTLVGSWTRLRVQ